MSTKMTPFYLSTSKHPHVPDTLMSHNLPSGLPAVEEFLQRIQNIIEIATENINHAQDTQIKYADMKRRDEEFQVGETILISTKNINVENQSQRPSKKLQPRYIGPYKIEEIISPSVVKVQLPKNMRIHPVFHTSQIKKYKDNPMEFETRIQVPPQPITIDDHEEFEVEAIMDKRVKRHGRHKVIEYLVKWRGYKDYDNSWENIDNLQNAMKKVQEFETQSVETTLLEGGE